MAPRAAKRHRVAGEGRQCAHAECSLLPIKGTQAKQRKQPSCRLTACKKQLCSRSPLSVAHFTAASEIRLSLSDAQGTSRDFPMDYCKRDPPSARVKLPRCNQSQTTWKGLGAMTDTQKNKHTHKQRRRLPESDEAEYFLAAWFREEPGAHVICIKRMLHLFYNQWRKSDGKPADR